MQPQTVLIVGSTGNIGLSAVHAALAANHHVLAVVRNQASAAKILAYTGSAAGITFAEADVLSDTGVQGVVDRVRKGELPAFQHVYACVGGEYVDTPLKDITTERLRYNMSTNLEANFFTYRATIPYLLSLPPASDPCTFTLCTGSQGDLAIFPVPALGQAALFALCTAACRENLATNVRFNEVYLAFRVERDADAAAHGVVSSSAFGRVYEQLLARPEIRSMRVRVEEVRDMEVLRFERRF